jgi:hypothetical protein
MPTDSFSLTVPQPDRAAASTTRSRREWERMDIVRVPDRGGRTPDNQRSGTVAFNKVKLAYSR